MKRFYKVKEITCPMCEGLGLYNSDGDITDLVTNENDCYVYEDSNGNTVEADMTCPRCKGKGYILNQMSDEGYAVYSDTELEFIEQPYFENPERLIKPLSLEDLGCMIAEHYAITEYQIRESITYETYDFQYGNMIMTFELKDINNIDKDAKYLIPNAFNFIGIDSCVYAVLSATYMLHEIGSGRKQLI